ncbi:hypothetical protein [Nitrosococcus halophilus]|uniref:hypothetical protein n=1 Tax=Nitrosococcus halophilus TaxID=133539 RepID=UPI0012FED446|nr:hypothetical protein [Nitrosococcus halophilus]
MIFRADGTCLGHLQPLRLGPQTVVGGLTGSAACVGGTSGRARKGSGIQKSDGG